MPTLDTQEAKVGGSRSEAVHKKSVKTYVKNKLKPKKLEA
jgi:hypothetical protein